MADISKELKDFKDAVYGEDVRDSLISMANKLNSAVSGSAAAAANSEANAKASETASKSSETAAKASENAAKSSETAAKTSENAAKASETAAKASENSCTGILHDAEEASAEAQNQAYLASQNVATAQRATESALKTLEDADKSLSAINAKMEELNGMIAAFITDTDHQLVYNENDEKYYYAANLNKGEIVAVLQKDTFDIGIYVLLYDKNEGDWAHGYDLERVYLNSIFGTINLGSYGIVGKLGMVPAPPVDNQLNKIKSNVTLQSDGWGKKLETDIVLQNGKYGYIKSDGTFVAFNGQ